MNGTLSLIGNILGIAIVIGIATWGLIRALKNSEEPAKIGFKIIFSVVLSVSDFFFARSMLGHLSGNMAGDAAKSLIMLGSIVACALILSVIWTPQICTFVLSPITNLFDGGNEPPEKKPFYSIANAKRKRGLYAEAVAAAREQLAKFPDDFEGLMLLAAIQAEDLKDLHCAEVSLNHFCASPKSPPRQVAAAWTTLADWHLKIGVDVDSARTSLQKIVERFPETELALRAQQRMAHLAGTEKMLLEQHDRPKMVVPEGVKNLGLLDSMEFLKPPEIEPGQLAAAHVKHLEAHPHDSEIREKLAVIYAKDFQRLDLATMELAQLINESRHSPKQIAGWLNQLANFQVELGADVATVRGTLEQIVARYPDLPLADITRRRLARINSEFKAKIETPGVKLGVYEQNIGLKYGKPGKA
jgi:tetratricopeptide (TPR) repeat protein